MAYEGKPGREFVDIDLVKKHFQDATQHCAWKAADSYRHGVGGALRHAPFLYFDSPLEVVFWLWWHAHADMRLQELFSLRSQQEVSLPTGEQYRVDFLLVPDDPRLSGHATWLPIAIELDGHAFHERTKDQVALRDSRDRALQKANWKVFHFSFSEFTSDPVACIDEVALYAWMQWNKTSVSEYVERHPHEVV